MERLRLFASTEMVHVATDKIVYVCDDSNYPSLLLMKGKSSRDSADALREYVFIDSSISRVMPIMGSISTKMAFSISHRSIVCLIKKN
jgi:hypothetical protein